MPPTIPALLSILVVTWATSPAATAQKLRRAVDAADLVLVGRTVRVIPTKTHVIHRVEIQETLRGPEGLIATRQIAVVETRRLAQHNKPLPARPMLMCLHDIAAQVDRMGLPANFGPYFKMSGHPGSAVVLDAKLDQDPRLEFARVLVASHKGTAPRTVAERLFTIALHGDARIRIEAAQTLAEREVLGGYLTQMHLSKILAKATGELDDMPYKIAMATICAEHKVPALIHSLCVSVEHVGDASFLQALGRFARYIHQDDAADALLPQLQRATGKTRDRLIYALGATSTEKALETLLEFRRGGENKTAVDAALRIHGSPRARAAVAKQPAPDADQGKPKPGGARK
jgi:hypothetical protein